jgi:hypothetical protein
MAKKRITASSAKAKGRWLQDWVAAKISDILNIPWGREDDSLIEPRQMGMNGVDVILRGEAAERFPFAIECKSGQAIGWQAAIRQARANTPKEKNWLVFMKTKEFKNPVVMLDANVFFDIMEKIV